MADTVYAVLFLFLILGLVVGSFLNVVILRLPDPEASIVHPPSHCPRCKTPIAWYDNVPLLSYLLLRGRCRHCRLAISWQYPAVEAAMGVLSVGLALRFGLTPRLAPAFVFCAALLAVTVIDIRLQIIPDRISLPGIAVGLAFSLLPGEPTWRASALGAALGGGSLYLLALGYYLMTRRDGMGGGDIKLLAMIGAFLGYQSLPFVVFFSSLTGAVVGLAAMARQGKGGQTRIPFGPFLAAGAYTYLFFQPQIAAAWRWYLDSALLLP